MTAGSNVLGSFSAFSYKFCEEVTTGRSKCLKTFSVSYHRFCAKVAAEAIATFILVYFIIDFVRKAVMISRVTASGSGQS